MKALALFLAVTLSSCAITERHLVKRCPSTQASLVDFTLVATTLALSTLAYNNDEKARAFVLASLGGFIGFGSAASECRRRVR